MGVLNVKIPPSCRNSFNVFFSFLRLVAGVDLADVAASSSLLADEDVVVSKAVDESLTCCCCSSATDDGRTKNSWDFVLAPTMLLAVLLVVVVVRGVVKANPLAEGLQANPSTAATTATATIESHARYFIVFLPLLRLAVLFFRVTFSADFVYFRLFVRVVE